MISNGTPCSTTLALQVPTKFQDLGTLRGLGIAVAIDAVGCVVGWTATSGVDEAFSSAVGVAITGGIGVTASTDEGWGGGDWDTLVAR